jgi:hypothetical protein
MRKWSVYHIGNNMASTSVMEDVVVLVVAMVAFHAGFRGSNPGALGERAQRNIVLAEVVLFLTRLEVRREKSFWREICRAHNQSLLSRHISFLHNHHTKKRSEK